MIPIVALAVLISFQKSVHRQAQHATARDRDVLQALLLSLLKDPDLYSMFPGGSARNKMILSWQSPDKTGMLDVDQVSNELKSGTLPADAWHDLRSRNCITGSWSSVPVLYGGLTFDPRIEVSRPSEPLDIRSFVSKHKDCAGYVWPWAPGYSSDGKVAVVRGWAGPTPHGASITAVLRKRGGDWVVTWHKLAVYM